MFTKAIVKIPCKNMVNGLSEANLGVPDYELAKKQHRDYINALEYCGLKVTVLEADEEYPDSTFVEDTAILTPKCAIITNPGDDTRKGEIETVVKEIKKHYENIEYITSQGTLDGGDVMMVGKHFYIGLSNRTNKNGAQQLINFLEKYGMTGSVVPLREVLHLKTGIVYLENNNVLASGEFLSKKEFEKYNILRVAENEEYSANCIWVNNKVIVPKDYQKTKQKIVKAGYETIEVDMSEFRKLDGGLSCLSLRF
ncbi:MAG: arginine deiminase family protein [Bacteroidales bacterium]|nr:arginine deiminase family protein [Bacteroidales bacterium]